MTIEADIAYMPWAKSVPFHLSAEDPDVDVSALITGAGYGKTLALVVEVIWQILEHGHGPRGAEPPWLAILVAPTHQMVRDVLIPAWEMFWPDCFTDRWSISEQKLTTTFGAQVHFRSAEKIDRIRGTRPNLIALDEARDMAEYCFRLALNRVSFRKGKVLVTTTPAGFDWTYDAIEVAARTNDRIRCYHATAYDNPLFDADTLDRQKDLLGDELAEQEVLGKRVQFKGRVYRHFEAQRHVDAVQYDPTYPLCVGVDFNIDPMSACLMHPWGPGWQVFDEVVLRHSDTDELCQEILKRYPDHRGEYWIYPDASGKAGHSSSRGRSDHAILREYFGAEALRSPKANPAIRDRVAALNRLLRRGHDDPRLTRFAIDPRCKTLIKGLEQLGWKGNIPDEQEHHGHITAALGYAEHYERPFHSRGLTEQKLYSKRQLRRLANA